MRYLHFSMTMFWTLGLAAAQACHSGEVSTARLPSAGAKPDSAPIDLFGRAQYDADKMKEERVLQTAWRRKQPKLTRGERQWRG